MLAGEARAGAGEPAVRSGDEGRVPTPTPTPGVTATPGRSAAAPPSLGTWHPTPHPQPSSGRRRCAAGQGCICKLQLCGSAAPLLWVGGLVSWARGGLREVRTGPRTSPRRPRVCPSLQRPPEWRYRGTRAERGCRGQGRAAGPDARAGLGAASPRARDLLASAEPAVHSERTPGALLRLLPPRPPARRSPALGCDHDDSPERVTVPASVIMAHGPPRRTVRRGHLRSVGAPGLQARGAASPR